MSMRHRAAWAFLVACVVIGVLQAADHQWAWVITMALFAIAAALTLWRYYTWPRRIRR